MGRLMLNCLFLFMNVRRILNVSFVELILFCLLFTRGHHKSLGSCIKERRFASLELLIAVSRAE